MILYRSDTPLPGLLRAAVVVGFWVYTPAAYRAPVQPDML